MTKKKLALLNITRDQILELDRKIYLLELDRKILHKEFYEMATTDEVPPLEVEIPSITVPMTEEEKVEVISDTILLKK
jgi:hypothetical protein